MLVYDITGLTKYYPGREAPANKEITLQIEQGEIFGLLGDNGAGKTTLVRQMVNLLRPSAGTITLYGRPLGDDPLCAPLHVGYMPQDSRALNNLTAGEALYYTAHLRGLGRDAAQRECNRLLELWQMENLRDVYTPRLSGGQKRLLQLAVAMAGAPPVLILDEPTNGLDPQHRKHVWEALRRINAEHGTTVIFITHDAIEAEKAIQRVGIMRQGELVAVGRPADLKKRVDRLLRLELFFAPEAPPQLPAGLTPLTVEPGRWLVYLERESMAETVNALRLEQLDDFRLYSATLEDLYLHYVQK